MARLRPTSIARHIYETGITAIPIVSLIAFLIARQWSAPIVKRLTSMERIRRIRDVDERHHLTLVCRDLSEVGQFAKVDNLQYRLMRANTPGKYTFILRATREVPRRLLTPRHTIGVRIPHHPVPLALLAELREPLLSSTLILPAHGVALNDAQEIRRHLEHYVDLVIDAGACNGQVTTVVDLSGDAPRLVREGAGDIRPFGFVKEALH